MDRGILIDLDIVALSDLILSKQAFCSDSQILNLYFQTQASQDEKKELTKCFVLINKKLEKIIGYYTLSATSINVVDIPISRIKKQIRYPMIPAALIGRLAIDRNFTRQGFGKFLIADAISKVREAKLGIAALLVEAKDFKAVEFYKKLGFIQFIDKQDILFLPLTKLIK